MKFVFSKCFFKYGYHLALDWCINEIQSKPTTVLEIAAIGAAEGGH
jgi:hypothetical protein